MKKTCIVQRVRLGFAKKLTKLGMGNTTEQGIVGALIFQP